MRILILSILIGTLVTSCQTRDEFDILISNGTIIDGTGVDRFSGNLAIKNGLMYLVSDLSQVIAAREIDASGLIVSPGFVDVHSHADGTFRDSASNYLEANVRQGVTTIVTGPDGYYSLEDMQNVLEAIEQGGLGINLACYIGYNGVRSATMGEDVQRRPTNDELEKMKADIRAGMEMGALGLSTGLMYPPGTYSETDEVIELAKEVTPYQGIYDSHVRNPVAEWIESNTEAIEIGRAAGIPVKLGHLKAVGINNTGMVAPLVTMVEEARAAGESVVSDQYPYDGAGGRITLKDLIVLDEELRSQLHQDDRHSVKNILANPILKSRIKDFSENGVNGGFSWIKAVGYDGFRVVSSKDYPELVGRFISHIAAERDIDRFDLIIDLFVNAENPVSVKGGIEEDNVQAILLQKWNMVASDGGFVTEESPSVGHPRSTGTFPRVLGHYVRNLGILTLEEAICKMTGFPAEFVGLNSRGRIANGLPADIVMFDPQTMIDHSTYDEPNKYSEGVIHLIVNGELVLYDGEMSNKLPGKFLKRERGVVN